MRTAGWGHVVFAATLIVLGVWGLAMGDYAAIWQPVPKGLPGRDAIAYLCALVALGSGLGMLWSGTAAAASRVLLGFLLVWCALFKVPPLFSAPESEESWSGCGETAVIIAGAWVLYKGLANEWDRAHLGFVSGGKGAHIARAVYGLALIPFGIAHFVYIKETADLVPGWLPWHPALAYFTGCAFLAAGLAVITRISGRLAASLSVMQMGLFSLLVWVPILVAGAKSYFQWSETALSIALTAAGWAVVDSYRGEPWFARSS